MPILVLSLFVSLFSSVSTKAATKELRINKKNSNEFSKTLQNLKDRDPQKAVSQKLEKNSKDNNELNSNQGDNLQIKFSLKDKKVKLKNKNKGDVSVGIPNSDSFDSVDVVNNKVIYSGQNAKFDVIVESVDGGFRQVINIKDSSAPDFYDFPVELGLDEKLVLNEGGSAAVIRQKSPKELENDTKIKEKMPKEILEKAQIPNYFTKLIIAKPWAKDANGKDLKTNYSIENGNILRQKIELKDAVFPVVADPIWCGNAITSVNWGYNGGLRSLAVEPSWCLRYTVSDQILLSFSRWPAWEELVSKTSVDSSWNKQYGTSTYWSMYDQFICHLNIFTFWKNYNLEPTRPNVGLVWTTIKTCNP